MLLLDDNPSVQRALARMLRSVFDVIAVSDCDEALAAMAAAASSGLPFDAVITDCEMPDGDGFEALRRISLVDAKLARRAVMWTGSNLTPAQLAAARAADIEIVLKHASAADVAAAVLRQIARHP